MILLDQSDLFLKKWALKNLPPASELSPQVDGASVDFPLEQILKPSHEIQIIHKRVKQRRDEAEAPSYKQKAVMRYVLWAFPPFSPRFVLLESYRKHWLLWDKNKYILLIAWTLIWIHAFPRIHRGEKAGYVFSHFSSHFVLCSDIAGSEGSVCTCCSW